MKIINNENLIIFSKKISIVALMSLGILLTACVDFEQSSKFILEKNDWFGKDDKLLIIHRNTLLIRHSFIHNQRVGEVDKFFLADFERAYRLP